MKEVAIDRMNLLKLTSMSHSPGTTQGADRLQQSFEEESHNLLKIIRFAQELYLDMPDDVYEDKYDGVMRIVE